MATERNIYPIDSAIAQEIKLLKTCFAKMPRRMRRVATLRKVYGLTQEEISKKLQITPDDVERELAAASSFVSARLFPYAAAKPAGVPPRSVVLTIIAVGLALALAVVIITVDVSSARSTQVCTEQPLRQMPC